MTSTRLWCLGFWIAGAALLSAACGGTTSGDSPSAPSGPPSPITPWPGPGLDAMEVFSRADAAFNRGDYVSAQRDFGTLMLIAPNFQNGLPRQALSETCNRLGVDCSFVFGRLEFMTEALYGAYGPREAWVPQQEMDFQAILGCYERAILGDYASAVAIAGPVMVSPLPGFATAAQRCAGGADTIVQQRRRAELADRALGDWRANYPCMEQHRQLLSDAYDAGDWERFVDVYPQYQQCAQVLQQIIDAELLVGDPRLGPEHDLAWTNMSEIRFIMEDNRATYETVRDAMIALDSNPEYNRLVVDWEMRSADEEALTAEIGSLEIARNALSGPDREALSLQIDARQSQLRQVRAEMRDAMGRINRLRRDAGLPEREQP